MFYLCNLMILIKIKTKLVIQIIINIKYQLVAVTHSLITSTLGNTF